MSGLFIVDVAGDIFPCYAPNRLALMPWDSVWLVPGTFELLEGV
jgi:hypothetical protein